MTWQEEFEEMLPALGHRNWVVIADAAFPQQISQGIKTLVSGQDHLEVLEFVWEKVKAASHVHPDLIYDTELFALDELDIAGVTDLRHKISQVSKGGPGEKIWHEDLLKMLDEQGQLYTILVIKTNSCIPYSSVFLRLGCGYWSQEKEAQFREKLKGPTQ